MKRKSPTKQLMLFSNLQKRIEFFIFSNININILKEENI